LEGEDMAYDLKAKIWLEKGNNKVFGDGPWDILKRVEKTGSLRQAAAEIRMSYSPSWRLIKMIERNLGYPVLQKKVGGSGGGYSKLTVQAAKLTAAYDSFRHEADQLLGELYQKHFSDLEDGKKR